MKTILALLFLAGTLGQSEVELGEQRMQTHRVYWSKTRACAATYERSYPVCDSIKGMRALRQCRAQALDDLHNCQDSARKWRDRELVQLGSPRRYQGAYR
ncbi:hypothetical protein P6144_12725 [Sphingomonas sp. HITSZ_GF]|uniref:hypothetical protein n=1 Tax=Sphingomonas sp. HITSZ_GF TaxID=3037247 RepID=UPI00240E7E7E|nr:hypothetical protein [Sphingomonas sp. HITSZ_GF]MDG2534517.1 hypothetical protein [Sphingomonas sp. HITSZ_GF]